MQINVNELLNSNSQNFDWQHLPINRFYKAKIINCFFGNSYFGGQTFKVIFKVLDENYLGRNISYFITYKNKNGFVSSEFIDFLKIFIDLEKNKEFEIENLIDEKCQIFVEENLNNKSFQKITKIKPFLEKLDA